MRLFIISKSMLVIGMFLIVFFSLRLSNMMITPKCKVLPLFLVTTVKDEAEYAGFCALGFSKFFGNSKPLPYLLTFDSLRIP